MALTANIDERNLAGNTVMLTVESDSGNAVVYQVLDKDDLDVYAGVVITPVGGVEIDISFLFENLKRKAGVEKYFAVIDDGLDSMRLEFFVFGGGISKSFMRALREHNTDIFEWKLKSRIRNFFLTTRTNSRIILIPENELMPIGCYPAGVYFYIDTDGDNIEDGEYASEPTERYVQIDFERLRKDYFDSSGKIASEFTLRTNQMPQVCTIVVTEAKPTKFFLKFLNSFGEFEKIALYGLVSYNPTFEGKDDILTWDTVIKDFARIQQRKTISHIYKAETGYRPASDRFFLLDMLLSDECYLMVGKLEYSVKVSTEADLFDSTDGQPINVGLTIEENDTDSRLSMLDMDKSRIYMLGDSDGNVILNDNNLVQI